MIIIRIIGVFQKTFMNRGQSPCHEPSDPSELQALDSEPTKLSTLYQTTSYVTTKSETRIQAPILYFLIDAQSSGQVHSQQMCPRPCPQTRHVELRHSVFELDASTNFRLS